MNATTFFKVSVAAFFTALVVQAADPHASFQSEVIAKAQPDECFYNLYDPEVPGSGENVYEKGGIDCQACITAGGVPKINQSYVWGMTRKDNYLWFGTGPNVNRLVSSVYLGASIASISSSIDRGIDFSVVEYADSKFARDGLYDGATYKGPPVDGSIGDWRPPDAYRYNLDTDALENLYALMDPAEQDLIWRTLGLRSAGYTASNATHTSGLVFLAGPSTTATTQGGDGIIMFAFDAATGDCVGAQSFPAYSNIRKWKFFDGQVYTAVATQTGTGEVLRWINNPGHSDYPFAFVKVGNLDAGGAELEIHDDGDGPRLFVNTWPGVEGNLDLGGDIDAILDLINAPAGLWRSPLIPAGGLTGSHSGNWNKVWSVTEYEPDLVVALHYGGGAMASYDGYLHWGTMHVPLTAYVAHSIGYGTPTPVIPRPDPYPEDPEDPARVAYEADLERFEAEQEEDFRNSYRAISIWRGKDFTNTSGDIELLYGSSEMPVRMERTAFTGTARGSLSLLNWGAFFEDNVGALRFVEDGQEVPSGLLGWTTVEMEDGGDWEVTPNTSGYVPLYGPEGIEPDSFFGGLVTFPYNNYTWTMQVFDGKLYIGTMDWDDIPSPDEADGAHLYCLPSSTEPAVTITRRGMENWSSYGIRTIEADESRGELYLGMANVNNLLSKKVGDPEDGGWEIQRVKLRYTDDDLDELDDGWEISNFGSIGSTDNPTGNTDGDPLSDYEEWLAGTDPNDTNSFFFAVPENAATEGLQQIEWPSVGGSPIRYYTVWETTSLTGTWSPVATYAGTGATMSHEYDPSLSDAKFFKVEVNLDAPAP
ncbi:hypothetical protein DDZ13_00740 [Coraliomargarita sinensis]|uniref:Uncharacterized protein n=1 Tax=Coraliomargarita sinensis TaxID=2174842 RepID=A0A317ZML9_9BACT|nr:thrombospondin type 3 repeat-containing protein [Coraliomargarita sinensis]PXA05427.1 hypothetical protein DDZ13_00740 [Coraliomargarita sinensis]